MGNYCFTSVKELKPQNKNIIKKLRRLSLYKVLNIFKDYVDTYYPNESLDAEMFDDIFSPLVNNTVPYFQIL